MECGKQNIKIVEGNEFALVLPLKQRTFVASTPIDEDIVYADLQDVVLKIGDTQFTATLETYGVQVLVPHNALTRGTYDILLTATYHGSEIRASYFEALTIVQYNSQSDAQQYIAGSPIVLDAAYVIGGTLTDAELEALKEEYREKNAQLDQAIADAEEAKREWEQKAADLDGVAKEATSQDILTAIGDIHIDTSDLAKQGSNPEATNTAILEAIQQGGSPADALETEVEAGKAAIVDAIEDKGGTASTAMSLTGLAQAIDSIQVPTLLRLNTINFENNANNPIIDMGGIGVINQTYISFAGFGSVREIRNFPAMPSLNNIASFCSGCFSLVKIDARVLDTSRNTSLINAFATCSSLKNANLIGFNASSVVSINSFFGYDVLLETLVGYETYQNVVDNDLRVFDGLNVSWSTGLNTCTHIDQASLRALINGLADRTGQSALTLSSLGADNLAKLSAEDIAVATAKNWNITA